jgi:hypothetical protein
MPEYGVCGHSSLNLGGCATSVTWLDAFNKCQQHGARLCTRQELMAAKETGCGLDGSLIWTWDECAHAKAFNQRIVATGNNHKIYQCAEAYEPHGAR